MDNSIATSSYNFLENAMDQQDNRTYPGASGQGGQGRPAAEGWEQKGQPAPVWEGEAAGTDNQGAAPGFKARAGQASGAQEPAAQDEALREQAGQEQPAQGWGAPVPGSPPAGWGTTTATGQVPNPGTGWGAPQQYAPNASPRAGKGDWTAKKGVLVGGVAVVVAAAAGAGAYAAGNGTGTASANNGQGTGSASQFGPGGENGMTGPDGQSGMDGSGMTGGMENGMGMDGGPGGLGMGSASLNAAVHSEYVVLQGSNYVTMAGQAGTVTEISATSLTVKSDDGFSRTYAVGSDVQVTQGMRQRGGSTGSTLSLSSVTTGASVRVTALKDSDLYTAQTIQLAGSTSATTPNSGTSSN
ncbi:hypothetical protein ACTAQI_20045 [Pseudarthrobacter sp. alpha12b]